MCACVSGGRGGLHNAGGMQPGWCQVTTGHPISRLLSKGKNGRIDTHLYTPSVFSGVNVGTEGGIGGSWLVVKLSTAVPAGQPETPARCTVADL